MVLGLMDENEFTETLEKLKNETERYRNADLQFLDPFVARVCRFGSGYQYFEGRGVAHFKYDITKEQFKILKAATEEYKKVRFESEYRLMSKYLVPHK